MSVQAPFGREVIQTILPHRDPFLLVDRVEELELDKRIVCVKYVTEDEYYQQDDGKGNGIYPVTLLAEVVAQAGALLVLLRPGLEGRPIYFMAIDHFEVSRPIRVGETIVIEAEPVRMRRRFGSLRGVARIDGEQVAQGVMRFAMDVPDEPAPSGA